MTLIERVVKYGFIFFIGAALTVGGVCGLMAIFGFIFGALNSKHANKRAKSEGLSWQYLYFKPYPGVVETRLYEVSMVLHAC